MNVAPLRSGSILHMRQLLVRSIIIEPAHEGQWVWRLYHDDGTFLDTRSAFGPQDSVIDSARDFSNRCGLPVFYRASISHTPTPMRRGGRKTIHDNRR